MNIIKHILCISFALTAWNAYSMFGLHQTFGKQSDQQNAEFDAMLTSLENEQDFDYNYPDFDTLQAEAIRDLHAQQGAFTILEETLPPIEFKNAQVIYQPTRILHATPQTSPVKPMKVANLNLPLSTWPSETPHYSRQDQQQAPLGALHNAQIAAQILMLENPDKQEKIQSKLYSQNTLTQLQERPGMTDADIHRLIVSPPASPSKKSPSKSIVRLSPRSPRNSELNASPRLKPRKLNFDDIEKEIN